MIRGGEPGKRITGRNWRHQGALRGNGHAYLSNRFSFRDGLSLCRRGRDDAAAHCWFAATRARGVQPPREVAESGVVSGYARMPIHSNMRTSSLRSAQMRA